MHLEKSLWARFYALQILILLLHKNMHTLVGMAGVALVTAVALPRYGDLNFP